MAQPRILITDNGSHPAAKWAEVIADEIVVIEATADQNSPNVIVAKKLRADIIAAITPLIEDCQKAEQEGRHEHSLNADPHIVEIQKVVNTLAGKSAFKAHFKQDHVQDHMVAACGQHLRTAMHIENLYKTEH